MMNGNNNLRRFKNFAVDLEKKVLWHNGEICELPVKAVETLCVLIERGGEVVTKDELLDAVWQDSFVEESVLPQNVYLLRKIFKEHGIEENLIQTVPRRGYRFAGELNEEFEEETVIERETVERKIIAESDLTDDEFRKLLSETEDFRANEKIIAETPQKTNGKRHFYIAAAIFAAAAVVFGIYLWQKNYPTNAEGNSPYAAKRKIAVSPFRVIESANRNPQTLQNGLLNSLMFNLGKIKNAEIVAFNENDAEKTKQKADYLLEGVYRFDSEKLASVNAEFTRIADGKKIFAESLTIEAENELELERIAALRISRKIYDELAAAADENFVRNENISENVREKYVAGNRLLRNYEMKRFEEGLQIFKEITETEPNWWAGWAKYTEALVVLHGSGATSEEISAAANKLLELKSDAPEAFLGLGRAYMLENRWDEAENAFKKAVETNPEYAQVYNYYGILLDTRRKFNEAETMYKKAVELDPFNPFYHSNLCRHYYYDIKFEGAKESCGYALDIEKEFDPAVKSVWLIKQYLGDHKALFEFEYKDLTDEQIKNDPLAKLLKNGDLKAYWRLYAEKRLNDKKRKFSPLAVAGFYAKGYDTEKTLYYLEQIPEFRPRDFVFANPDPIFNFIREEPRFLELQKKYNLAQ